MEKLSSFFDFKFDQLNVRYFSNKHPSGADVFSTDSESLLNLGCPGVILLLGKNGSGKSRFLKSLGSYARHSAWSPSARSLRQPEISFRYSVPTIEENYQYLETRKNILSNDPEFSEMKDFLVLQNYKNDRLNLFFHDALISTICTRALNLLVLDNFGLEPRALLEHFGFTEPEIGKFEKRINEHKTEFEYHPAWDELERPRENLNFRDYFVEFFLTLLSYSTLHKVPWDVGPGSWFDCRNYLSDKDELVRLVSALRELFENTTHVEIRGDGKNMWLSLIDQNAPGPELEQVLNLFKDLGKKYENQTFPFDLLRVEESFAATAFLPLSIGTHSGWHPLDVVDATFVSREKSFDGLNEIFRGFLKFKVIQKDSPHYQVDVSGLEAVETLLHQVNKLLPNVDIGVSKIELQEPNHTWNLEEKPLWTLDRSKHDFTPIVGWQDSITKKWLPLDVCSDGQLEVVRILVNLCKLTGSDSISAVKFLLIDEFDRHLNPVIAQQTLNLIDRYAKKFNTYVLLSTHTIGSLDVYKHNQIFASRDAAGLFNLSMNRTGDQLFLADQLGIPERDMSRFSKLFVVVEGDHEELIFNELFATNNLVDYEIVNLVGLKQARGKWRSELQYENADVLVVYDNRIVGLEKEWSNFQEVRGRARFAEKLFEKSGFKKMRLEAYSRLNRHQGLPGDIEMNYLGFLLEEILDKTDNQQKNIKRLHLHGMEVSDIVDCLPIKEFPMASKAAKSWEELHKEYIELTGPEFKKKFDINNKTVEKAVKSKNFNEPIHGELQRLWDRILGLTEVRPNWM